jgi:serine/threonine protein kinase
MHRRKIAFRDLKPENVMVDADGYPIIVDFGFAKVLNADGATYTFCGTPQYLAPEICANTGHGYAVDHWVSSLLWEMMQPWK